MVKDVMAVSSQLRVSIILQTFFQNVMSLEAWIRFTDTAGLLGHSLVTEEDLKGYKHLLATTLVAVKTDSKKLTMPFSFSQDSHQHELVVRCVQRVLRRDGPGNNVLSFGFGTMTDNPKASLTSVPNIEYRYPNTSVSRLQYKVWKTLLSRIGDTLMGHLLENTSVFILLVKPAVYLQITGEPVYQLWPYSASSSCSIKEPKHQSHKPAQMKSWGKHRKKDRKRKNQAQKDDETWENSTSVTKKRRKDSLSAHHFSDQGAVFVQKSGTPKQDNKERYCGKRGAPGDMSSPECKRRKICDDTRVKLPSDAVKNSLVDSPSVEQSVLCPSVPPSALSQGNCERSIGKTSPLTHQTIFTKRNQGRVDNSSPLSHSVLLTENNFAAYEDNPMTACVPSMDTNESVSSINNSSPFHPSLKQSRSDTACQSLLISDNKQQMMTDDTERGQKLISDNKQQMMTDDTDQGQKLILDNKQQMMTDDTEQGQKLISENKQQMMTDDTDQGQKLISDNKQQMMTNDTDQGQKLISDNKQQMMTDDTDQGQKLISDNKQQMMTDDTDQGQKLISDNKQQMMTDDTDQGQKLISDNKQQMMTDDTDQGQKLISDIKQQMMTDDTDQGQKLISDNKQQMMTDDTDQGQKLILDNKQQMMTDDTDQGQKLILDNKQQMMTDDTDQGQKLILDNKQQMMTDDTDQGQSLMHQSASDSSVTVVLETSDSSIENLPACADGDVHGVETNSFVVKDDQPQAASMTKRQTKRIRQKRKKQKQKPCTSGTRAYQHHLYAPRLSLLYGKYLREKFPANFSLARFSPSEDGANSLFTDIFVQGIVGGNIYKNGQQCQCQETGHLPKSSKGENPCLSDTFGGNKSLDNVQDMCPSQAVTSRKAVHICNTGYDTQTGSQSELNPRIQINCMDQGNIVTSMHGAGGSHSRSAQASSYCADAEKNTQGTVACQSNKKAESSIIPTVNRSSECDESSTSQVSSSISWSGCTIPCSQRPVSSSTSSSECAVPCGQRQVSSSTSSSGCTIPCGQRQVSSCTSSNECTIPCGQRQVSSSTSLSGCAVPCGQRQAEKEQSLYDRHGVMSVSLTSRHSQQDHTETGADMHPAINHVHEKHLIPADFDCTAPAPDDRTPMHFLLEESTSSRTYSPDPSVRSPMDIIVAESPSLSQISSRSSSSFTTSNSNSDTSFMVKSPLILDHSSFYADGSSRDRTLALLSMTSLTLKESFPEDKDHEKSLPSTSRSSDAMMVEQIHQKETPLLEVNDPFLKQSLQTETLCTDGQQEQGGTKGTGQKDSVMMQKSFTDSSPAASPTPTFQVEVLPFLQKLLLNHRKCKHWALLNRHCPSKFDKSKMSLYQNTQRCCQKVHHSASGARQKKKGHQINRRRVPKHTASARLLEDHVSHQKVFAFLRAVVKQNVPVQLMGSTANMAVFLRNVHTLVSSGKFEKMCLGQLMKGMKVKGCMWLSGVSCQMERVHRIAQLIWWLVVSFIFPVIRTFFYLTDTTTYRNRVFYYRKRTWLRLHTRAVQEFRKETCLKPISKLQVNELLASGQSLGVSVLRFLPKLKSLRPIVNMSSKPKPGCTQKQSINKQLKNLFQALTSEKMLDESICGCSMFGLEDIYRKLKHFKQKRASCLDDRCLYFVKSDVSNCFDSIQQRRLFQLVKGILTKDNEQTYMTRKFATLHVAGKRVKRAFHTDTTRLTHYQPDFVSFLRRQCSCDGWNDIIVVDMAYFHEENTASLLHILSAHLFNNIIRIGGRHYLQTTGISQGSVMSTLLASIYLAHLENTHLSIMEDELLIRRMDDYLFITPDRARAQQFMHTMVNGFPDFNCFTNVEKILTNFPIVDSTTGAVNHIAQEGAFPWCGLMINTRSLEVSVDYSRYSGLSVTDTATFDTSYKAGQTLNSKLLECLKIKCNPIFFDPELNSKERIVLNVYQALLFMAGIFHSFVIKLPASQRVESNPHFFASIIKKIPGYIKNFVVRKFRQAKCVHQFPIQFQMLHWLNADAFLTRLHHYPGYKPLKKFLRARKISSQRKLGQENLAILREVHQTGVQLHSDIVLFRAPL